MLTLYGIALLCVGAAIGMCLAVYRIALAAAERDSFKITIEDVEITFMFVQKSELKLLESIAEFTDKLSSGFFANKESKAQAIDDLAKLLVTYGKIVAIRETAK